MTRAISNFDALSRTPERAQALEIAEAAYAAINTGNAIRRVMRLDGSVLSAGGRDYDLSRYKRVRVIGVGKASCSAVQEIERILKGYIHDGLAIDVHPGVCDIVDVVEGSHPHPTPENVAATERVVAMSADKRDDDLFLVVVSGGGSSLLCYPYSECDQGTRLYEELKHTEATIAEMNTVRKHLSSVKGGGLAALLAPCDVIGLIFCDIPGDDYADVASGPTYIDRSTIADAQVVLDRYGLTGYTLNETPKDEHMFAHVHNVPVVSNVIALDAMEAAALARGYSVVRAGSALYDETDALAARMLALAAPKSAVIAGGEPRLKVPAQSGKGGRCTHTALHALSRLKGTQTFLTLSSDGHDNSDAAGAIVDAGTREKAKRLDLNPEAALAAFDTYPLLEKTDDLLKTGPTDSNVSDLFVLLTA